MRRHTSIGAAVLVLATAGCSGGSEDDAGSASTPTPSQAPTSVGQDTVSPPDLPMPPEVRDAAGGVADIEVTQDCGTGPGTETVSGRVTNPTRRTTSYVVTYNWINDTLDVRGRGFTVVSGIEPGQTREWSVEADVADGATQCVPNVLRGRVQRSG